MLLIAIELLRDLKQLTLCVYLDTATLTPIEFIRHPKLLTV